VAKLADSKGEWVERGGEKKLKRVKSRRRTSAKKAMRRNPLIAAVDVKGEHRSRRNTAMAKMLDLIT